MSRLGETDLILIRHAPTDAPGRLCGRTDAPARLDTEVRARLERMAAALAGVGVWIASPARRCTVTAAALTGAPVATDARLWEQDFGAEDGRAHADLPDLGPLSAAALAERRPPGGESFAEAAARMRPALEAAADRARVRGPVAVVAHAGTVRAALALALDNPAAALGFAVAPLSVTRLVAYPGGLSVACVNCAEPA